MTDIGFTVLHVNYVAIGIYRLVQPTIALINCVVRSCHTVHSC